MQKSIAPRRPQPAPLKTVFVVVVYNGGTAIRRYETEVEPQFGANGLVTFTDSSSGREYTVSGCGVVVSRENAAQTGGAPGGGCMQG